MSKKEGEIMLKMAQDDVDITQAIKALKQNRNDNLPLWKKAVKIPFNLSV
tara:strand:- start:288 stop:437 length:150 start_codon:yes stop_codon:yes gene_type:complete